MWRGRPELRRRARPRSPTAPAGSPKENFLASDVPGGANQSTILIATPEAAEQFGITADETLSPARPARPGGGAVCWESLDCVSWGSFSGSLPSPTRRPCPRVSPTAWHCGARSRPAAPPCSSQPTTATTAPPTSASSPRPAPELGRPERASLRGVRRLARRSQRNRWKRPRSPADDAEAQAAAQDPRPHADLPLQLRRAAARPSSASSTASPSQPAGPPSRPSELALGQHTFKVRARDECGELDPSPASYSFRVRGAATEPR